MATTSKVISYEEMLSMSSAEGVIEEVIDGEMQTMPANKAPHAAALENLADMLRSRLDRQVARILITNFGLLIRKDPVTCRVPDLAIFRVEDMIAPDGYFIRPPGLVAEVLSPGKRHRDIERLLRDYEDIGVAEVWLLSLEERTLEILQLFGGRLQSIAKLNGGSAAPMLFPNAVVDIGRIWP